MINPSAPYQAVHSHSLTLSQDLDEFVVVLQRQVSVRGANEQMNELDDCLFLVLDLLQRHSAALEVSTGTLKMTEVKILERSRLEESIVANRPPEFSVPKLGHRLLGVDYLLQLTHR